MESLPERQKETGAHHGDTDTGMWAILKALSPHSHWHNQAPLGILLSSLLGPSLTHQSVRTRTGTPQAKQSARKDLLSSCLQEDLSPQSPGTQGVLSTSGQTPAPGPLQPAACHGRTQPTHQQANIKYLNTLGPLSQLPRDFWPHP